MATPGPAAPLPGEGMLQRGLPRTLALLHAFVQHMFTETRHVPARPWAGHGM